MNSEQNNVVMVTQWPTKGVSEITEIKPDVDPIVALDALTKVFIQQQERTNQLLKAGDYLDSCLFSSAGENLPAKQLWRKAKEAKS